MSKHKQTEKLYSLKDQLFNEVKVKQLAGEIKAVYPTFDSSNFIRVTLAGFPDQELMQRLIAISDNLHTFLPANYKEAVAIILKALPPVLDEEKEDADFGDFIHAPYSYFVAKYGCNKKDLKLSLKALREITMRFSAEGSLRDFLNNFPEETLVEVERWAKDKNYHVRRLASEGTRPSLPWAKKITTDPERVLPILEILYQDKTRYVTRSVANHLNDLSKLNPNLVVTLLKRWQKTKLQSPSELHFITKHALRTLIKKGNQGALNLLGFREAKLELKAFKLQDKQVTVGETLQFSMTLTSTSQAPQAVLIDYVIYFKKANGKLAPKVFKLSKITLAAFEARTLTKSHALKLMSTRTLYTGEHELEIQVNGVVFAKEGFILK